MMNVDREKWISLGRDLRDECGDGAKFEDVYLIDDFTASGTTFIRLKDGQPKGKLPKFEKMVSDARVQLASEFPIAGNYRLHIHHYVSTVQAQQTLLDRIEEVVPCCRQRVFRTTLQSMKAYFSLTRCHSAPFPKVHRLVDMSKLAQMVFARPTLKIETTSIFAKSTMIRASSNVLKDTAEKLA